MSIKKNIGVLVLLLVLLSMSAVSAEDVSINANDTYQTPNEIQKDFTSLQTDIDNSQGVFELTYDVKHGDDEIDNYGISITKTTIINGNGHTIDANGHGSIFVVKDSSVTLTLNDLTLINANPVSDSSGIVSNGGAVYFDGSTLIVNNVNFKNNTVYKYGGAIYTTGTCIVDSSVFDGNDVQFRSQNIDNGGAAIYADNGASLLISNSQIINNHKNMVIRDNNVGDLVDGVVVATGYTKISKSYFRNNSGCYGGAVTSLGYTNAGKNQIIIENSVFDANRAFQGAAVNVIGSTFKISGTNFTNNKGVGYGSGNPNVGALLTWYNCEGTISDCNFINNTADNGAAYRLGDDNNGVSSASVDSCTFINNTASNQGGAVYEGGKTGKATLDIKNSIFTNNSAKKEGSAIYSGYTLNIDDDTTFTNNMVYMYYTGTLNIGEIKTFTDLQNAINMVEGDIHLSSNVTMLASEADNFVNGIVVDHLVNLKCDGFTINANNLGRIFNVTSTADKLNIYNANLINGNADIGGAIYNTGSVYAYNTNFINNTAATMGGAVFNNGTLTIQKCIVDNNDITKRTSSDSEDYGGAAIYNWYDSTLFIKNSTISNNLKNYKNGDYVVGAVTSLGKTIISQNSYFVNNSGRWGGAITTSGSSLPGKKVNELIISDSTFSKNGGLYGAGIFIQGSKFSITSCVFDSNTASGKGNMTPNNNNGGALVVTQGNIPISGTIINSNFTNNKAQYGGAAWINEGTIDISNSNFINNTATVEAGAIGFEPAYTKITATVYATNFINNTAGVDGGAIYSNGDLRISDSDFDNNKAQKADIIYSNINGLLNINGNNYSNYTENKAPIINLAGIETISSDSGVIITVLDNKTVNVCYGDVVTLHAIITVDGVLVANQDLSFSVYNGEDVVVCKANSLLNGSYVATYKINDVINKTVSIVYDGPEVHINTGILNVSKANPDLTVGALNITVGDLEIITVTGPKDATGLITLTLNGIDYILPIYNGEAKFYFQDLAYGTYDVSASYSGDNHYVAAENSTVFKVDKVLANLKINVEDITFGENGLVIITLPSDIDGSIVTVNVNGKVYPVDIENGFGKLPLRELDAGDYTISAVFAGNDKYLPGVSNALLTVSKADPALNVLISDVGYDGVFNINVALTGVDAIGLNGNVIVTVNNKDYSVNIVNGKGTAVGVKLAAGTYDFTAAWAGNDNYNAVGDSGKFSVAKVDSIIDVAVSDIKVGEDAVISVKLLSDATGSVTVTVNGKDYTETVVNGVANVKVADLKAGTYDVAVKYSGDNNYNAAVATSSFTVSKVDSTMDVTVNDIVFGGDLIVDAVLPVDATGEVVITVNGVDYHVSIENGKATGTISGLAAGDYTVAIKYVGDDKYIGVEVAENVNVAKAQPVLGVVIADVDYGNGFVIEATLTGVNGAPLSGNVIVTVAGKEYTVKVTDGKGIVTGDKLAAGTYAFAAAWAGDDNYNIVTENGDFKVNKVDSAIDVAVSDIKVGEDAVISVKLASDATGEVVITVNGEDYTAAIENGVASVTVSDLKAGDYTVTVKYTGDNNYNEATGSAEFSVLKITPEMDVTVEDIVFGEDLIVNAVLPVDATGEVVITVNGVDYHVAIENGVASVTVSGLEAGDYTVEVKYAGDDNYNAAEVTKGVNVAKANPALNVIIDSVDYGNVFTINAVLTGVNNAPLDTNIIVTVNGKNYIVAIVNGKGTFHADKLAAGSYNFNARFAGSNNYNEVSDSGKFNVYKVDSAIGITVKDINVGEDAVITVKLFSDATGELTVTVNGKDYTANVVNGRATVSVSDLKAGNYDVVAKYSGDNNYNAAVATSSFTVSKVDSTMDVTVNDIVFGGDLIVDAVLPVDATGEVVITVNGVDYHVSIENGKATGTISGLAAGDYTVAIKYVGDDKYIGVEVAENVNVAKAQPVLGVVIADVDYGNGFVIEATLTGVNNAPLNGNVIVTVNGKEYTVKVTDGKGIATGDKLAAGTYAFAAAWAGNDNYNIVTENGDFKVNKIDSTVAVNADDIKVGENVTVTVNVPTDATGDVIIIVDGVDYTVAIENGKAVKTIADLKANDYTVTVKYSGDNNYNANQNTTEFTVSKISDYNMNITVPEFKEGVNSTINVVLPKDATGTVTVEIGGKNYTANVTDGVANVIIPGLGVGDYNITTTYSGDAKYDLMTKKGNITVIPNVDVNLDVDDVVMVYHDGTRLVAKLTDYQGKPIVNATIYFNINGVNYARTTDANGTASIALNLESGAYPVIVAYNGSASYSKISKNITVTINPSIIADDLVKMYKNDTKFSAKFLGSDGKVLANTTVKFNINGVLYTRTTNNDGVGSLAINLRPGEYVLTAYNPVTGEQQGFNITVKSLIVTQDLTKYYMNASSFQATIYDKNGSLAVGKNVTFNINGVFYTRTADENGVVSLAINLRPGEYIITTIYEELDIGNNVVVLPTLVTSDLNMTYRDGSKFTAQTLDGQGKPLVNQNVTFNVNGRLYFKTTGDDGVASLTINLMSGKYIITSYWNDFQTGNTIIIS